MRDDYKELVDLSILYLSGKRPATIRKPGAMSTARWMCPILYAIKIVMLSNQQSVNGILKEDQLIKLTLFVNFCVVNYVVWWMKCSSACEAPSRDLNLLEKLTLYQDLDTQVATAAKKAFKRHQWYLKQNTVPLFV